MTTIEKAGLWLSESFDEETRTKVQQLIDEKPPLHSSCFGAGFLWENSARRQ